MDGIEQASYYLAGIIDGEGYVKLKRGSLGQTREKWQRRVEIVNTDPGIIQAACEALECLGVTYTVKERPPTSGRRAVLRLTVYGRENYEKLRELPLRGEKKARLAELVDSYAGPPVPTKAEVEHLLEAHGTERAAAAAAGVAKSTVQYWKRVHSIPSARILPLPTGDEIRAMLAEHGSERRAALATGHARKTIRRWRRLRGV